MSSYPVLPVWIVLRLTLAGLIGAHGWARWLSGGVAPFGQWLESQGWPAGLLIASAITLLEIAGTMVLLLTLLLPLLSPTPDTQSATNPNTKSATKLLIRQWPERLVLPLCLLYSAIYAMGIALVHAPAGWFVVGLGRNGAEYSVLLIVVLLCVGWQSASQQKPV